KLAGVATSATQVNLTWTAATDDVAVTGYRVRRGSTLLATVTKTSFSDTTAAPSTAYSYTVSAIDKAGNESAGSTPAAVTTPADAQAPTAPANVVATATGDTTIGLNWNPATDNYGVTGYQVWRGATLLTTVTGTSFGDTGLTPSTTYSYTVRAVDLAGNVGVASSSASVTTQPDTRAPTVPADLAGTATSATQVNLTWPPATDDVAVTR